MAYSNRENEIIDELNELAFERENTGDYILAVVVDSREDEGLPPFTPEELDAARKECDENCDKVNAIEKAMDKLLEEYRSITGKSPHYNELTDRFSINFGR